MKQFNKQGTFLEVDHEIITMARMIKNLLNSVNKRVMFQTVNITFTS